MNQEERLDYLVKALCDESVQYKNVKVAKQERMQVLRSLMNVRAPKPISQNILEIQDDFLTNHAKEKGIVTFEDIPTINDVYHSTLAAANRISIWQGDITRLQIDGIVNAANSQMLGCFVPCHACIDNAIHSAAGIQLRLECNELMERQQHEEETGKAKITKGYNLPAKYVIHTVGPIVNGRLTVIDCDLLKSCYESCLSIAEKHNLKSIAFCCISTGVFQFPNDKAAEIAIETVNNWLKSSALERVVFNVFKQEDLIIYENLVTD